jgi:hypothetical protein
MIKKDNNDFPYYDSLDSMKEDCLQPIPVISLCQFFTLEGRKVQIKKENIIPIPDLTYSVLAKHPEGDRYYTRVFKGYSLDELFFYLQTQTFSGEDTAIENLRRYTEDSRVILMFKPEQMAETIEMLKRLYKSYFKSEGQVPYKIWVRILENSIAQEDYQDYGKALTGYRTVLNQYDLRITELWNQAKK